jgi:hypothetical protein
MKYIKYSFASFRVAFILGKSVSEIAEYCKDRGYPILNYEGFASDLKQLAEKLKDYDNSGNE